MAGYIITHYHNLKDMSQNSILHDARDNKRVLIDPVLHLTGVGRGTLQFSIASTNPEYNNLVQLKSFALVTLDGNNKFVGRVIDIGEEFNTVRDVVVEDLACILNDLYLPPFEYDGTVRFHLETVVSAFNQRIGNGFIHLASPQISANLENKANEWKQTDYVSAKTVLDEAVSQFGGFYYVNLLENGMLQLHYEKYEDDNGNYPGGVEHYPLATQEFRFGSNILDLSQQFDGKELKTQVIPLGKTDVNGERLTIESVNNEKDYLRSAQEVVDKYGLIETVVIHDDVEEAEELLVKGQKDLERLQSPLSTIELKGIDLQRLDINAGQLNIGEYAHVISRPHGVDTHLKINEITLNLENPERDEFVLGHKKAEFTD